MASTNGNQSTGHSEKIDLKMNEISFEPTSIPTRRDYIRNILRNQFAKAMNDKLAPEPVDDSKHLQGTKIVHDPGSYVKTCANHPLHGGESADFSYWSAFAHPERRYKRSYEFTKPDSEYFGNSQWR